MRPPEPIMGLMRPPGPIVGFRLEQQTTGRLDWLSSRDVVMFFTKLASQ